MIEKRKCNTCKRTFKGYKKNGIWVSAVCPKCRLVRKNIKLEKKKKTKKYQESERKKLHKKAWRFISAYVREKSYNKSRNIYECYTCGKGFYEIRELQCGHRYHGRLDFDLRNLKAQCSKCNCYLHGNLGIYERRLIEENGIEWCKKLELDANQDLGYSIKEIKEIIKLYGED